MQIQKQKSRNQLQSVLLPTLWHHHHKHLLGCGQPGNLIGPNSHTELQPYFISYIWLLGPLSFTGISQQLITAAIADRREELSTIKSTES